MTSRTARLIKHLLAWGLAGCALATLATLSYAAEEAWVLNAGTRSISVIDLPTRSLLTTFSLPDLNATGPLRGLSFSTAGGFAGSKAFVTEGQFVSVIDVATRALTRTIDLELITGRKTRAAGCEAAPRQSFGLPGGIPTLSAYLYIAASVQVDGQNVAEPWYFVFDQTELIVGPRSGWRADGPLLSPTVPVSDRGEALHVSVMGNPLGLARQRAWFTTRAQSAAGSVVRAVELAANDAGTSWSVKRATLQAMPPGQTAPDTLRIGVPYDRNLPILPLGPARRALDPSNPERYCDTTGQPAEFLVTGPAQHALHTYYSDTLGDTVWRLNEETCDEEPFVVGKAPTALTRFGTGPFGEVAVVNRDDDTVSLIDKDGVVTSIDLDPGPPGPSCVLCPRAIATTGPASARGCVISPITLTPAGVNTQLSWTSQGCGGLELMVWCQCSPSSNTASACPCYCDPSDPFNGCEYSLPPSSPLGPDAGGSGLWILPSVPWEPIGPGGGTGFTHLNTSSYSGSWSYTVVPQIP
jgi:hypothetical protein